MTNSRKYYSHFALILVFIAGSLLIAGLLLPPLPVFITDNGNKYIIMRDFAETGTLFIDHIEPALFPRGGFHFQTLADGAVYSFHSWVLPAISALFYRIAGENGALLPVWLSGLAILLLLGNDRKSRLTAWGLLLTTPVWLYSQMLWEMVPSALAVLAASILLKKRHFFGAGLILGLGIWFREELYILSAVIVVLMLISRRWHDVRLLTAGGITGVLPLWLCNFFIYGHILGLHGATYALNNRTEFALLSEIQGLFFNFYQHLLRFETLAPGPSLALSIIGTAALFLPGFFKNRILKIAGLTVFTLIDLIFIGYLFQDGCDPAADTRLFLCGVTMSLFFTLPPAAGFFLNLRQLWNDRNQHIRFMTRSVTIFIFAVPPLLTRFDIGLTFGARHYICIMPLLMLLSFRGFARMQIPVRIKQFFIIVLCTGGIILQCWGFTTLYRSSHCSAALEEQLAASPETTVVTDVFFLPEQSPRIFFDKSCLELTNEKQLKILLDHLKQNKIDNFILILAQDNNFRRMSNEVLGKLLMFYPPVRQPETILAAPGMPLFIVHCRRAVQQAAR